MSNMFRALFASHADLAARWRASGFDDSGPKSSGPRDHFVSATWCHDHLGSKLSQETGGILVADNKHERSYETGKEDYKRLQP